MQTTQANAPHNRTLGQRVQALRKAHPAQLTQIAAGCQVSTNTLWNIEGGRGCRSETLAHLGAFFGVSLDYLLGLTDTPTRLDPAPRPPLAPDPPAPAPSRPRPARSQAARRRVKAGVAV
jgi:transcriptional regulator with XRE-family HTH domain